MSERSIIFTIKSVTLTCLVMKEGVYLPGERIISMFCNVRHLGWNACLSNTTTKMGGPPTIKDRVGYNLTFL